MKYSGLCIGGPLDGEKAESEGMTTFTVIVKREVPGEEEPLVIDDTAPIGERCTYVIKQFSSTSKDGTKTAFTIWCPEDKDEAFIMRQLLTSYERKHTP